MEAFLGAEVLPFICCAEQSASEPERQQTRQVVSEHTHNTAEESGQQLQTKQGKGQPGPLSHVRQSLARGSGGSLFPVFALCQLLQAQ
uniref:Uncharacterized protein n=1 Tax=Mus spicilegus TaxID=10103 RepID=A0A8C6GL68_MUSSI